MRSFSIFLGTLTFLFACSACGDADKNTAGNNPSTPSKISIVNESLSAPDYSPDGATLAIIHTTFDGPFSIATIGLNGDDLNIIANDAFFLTNPVWSPDGTAIIYAGEDHNIYRIKADGSSVETLFKEDEAVQLDLSPDGTKLAFTSTTRHIKVRPLAGGDDLQPNEIIRDAGHPRFSPDGNRIAYVNKNHVGIVNADGSDPSIIAEGGFSSLSQLAWFPGGERVAVTSDLGVEIITIATGDRETVTELDDARDIAISPDGGQIIYDRNSSNHLTVINLPDRLL